MPVTIWPSARPIKNNEVAVSEMVGLGLEPRVSGLGTYSVNNVLAVQAKGPWFDLQHLS